MLRFASKVLGTMAEYVTHDQANQMASGASAAAAPMPTSPSWRRCRITVSVTTGASSRARS